MKQQLILDRLVELTQPGAWRAKAEEVRREFELAIDQLQAQGFYTQEMADMFKLMLKEGIFMGTAVIPQNLPLYFPFVAMICGDRELETDRLAWIDWGVMLQHMQGRRLG